MPENWQRTAPLGIVARALNGLKSAIIPLIAVTIGSGGFGGGFDSGLGGGHIVGPIIVLAAVAGNFLFSWIAWRHHRYALGADDIRVERGLVSRHSRAVPYDRIQDVALNETPISRLFGLVEVKFETGAGGKDELKLAYVTRDQGEMLRNTVRALRDDSAAAALADAGETVPTAQVSASAEAPARLLFRMGLPRLVLFGIFEFSLVVFAVLFGAAEQLDFLLPFDVWNPEGWWELLSGPLGGAGRTVAEMGLAVQVMAGLLALASLATLGLATGVVRTVARDWGFRLERTECGLRRRRGLISRSDMVMPVRRVQALVVSTGIVRRALGGWHALGVVSLAQDEKSASHVVVPFATMAEIAPVVAETGFALPGAGVAWRRTSPAHHRNMALFCVLPLVAVAAGLLLADPWIDAEHFRPGWITGALFIVALIQCLRQFYRWRHDCFALDDGQLFVRRGWLSPRLDIVSRIRVQTVELVQGPFGRSDGYASLRFGIAGGTLEMDGLALDDAMALRAAVLDSVAALDFSRLPK